MSYKTMTGDKPINGQACVVITSDYQAKVAFYRIEMGTSGGFAIATKGKRSTRLDYLPDVVLWEELRCPSREECAQVLPGGAGVGVK